MNNENRPLTDRDVTVMIESYRDYVYSKREEEVEVPRLRFMNILTSSVRGDVVDALNDLRTTGARLGATHIFGVRLTSTSREMGGYDCLAYVAYGDAYHPIEEKKD